MTELERQAVLGNRKAQKDCTKKGIILPCPKCYGPICITETVIRLDLSRVTFKCTRCNFEYIAEQKKEYCLGKSEFIYQSPFEQWNFRHEPPINRCKDCKYLENIKKRLVCFRTNLPLKSENDFCSYFEQKQEEPTE